MDRDEFALFLRNWIGGLVSAAPRESRPLLVGLSAPQGAGKTTLTRQLCQLASLDGLNAVSLSIDDFYLRRQEQIDLAERHSNNPYLQRRGYPGTHDIDLGTSVLQKLKSLGASAGVAVPSYDRFAYAGMGDRRPQADWPIVQAPLDVAILEGWMLGFTPVEPDTLADPLMRAINEYLHRYAIWLSYLDAFVWLEPEDPRFVLDWRVEAETRSRAEGHAGMSSVEIETFVQQFLPAYSVYLPGLRERSPVSGPFLRILIGHDRLPKSIAS